MKTLFKALRSLSLQEKIVYFALLILKLFSTAMDLAGLVLVGLAASLIAGDGFGGSTIPDYLLNFVRNSGIQNSYAVFGVLASIFFLLRTVFSLYLNSRVASFLSNIEARKSLEMFQKIMYVPLSKFRGWNENKVSTALNNATYVTWNFSLVAGFAIFGETALIVSVCVFLAMKNISLLGLLVVYFGAIALFISLVVNRRIHNTSVQTVNDELELDNLVRDYINLNRQFRVRGTGKSIHSKFALIRQRHAKNKSNISKWGFLPRYIIESALMAGLALILLQRAYFPSGQLDASVIAIFLAGALRIVASLLPLQANLSSLKTVDAQAQLARDFEKIQSSAKQQESRTPSQVRVKKPVIEMNDVSFGYSETPSAHDVIQHATFRIPFGAKVALVGKSGSGKSTLVDLLIGVQEPLDGLVTIGGLDAGDYVRAWPGKISYVAQNNYLMKGSLLENILLEVNPQNVDSIKLAQAVKESNLSEFINSLPHGLQTQVGSGQRQLSGGQCQRVSIARALYGNAEIVIFDEPTSSLDVESTEQFEKTTNKLRGSATVIVITHDHSKLDGYDYVIEIKNQHVEVKTNNG